MIVTLETPVDISLVLSFNKAVLVTGSSQAITLVTQTATPAVIGTEAKRLILT